MLRSDDHVLDSIEAFLHEALSPGEHRAVAEHCEKCRICRVALEEGRKRLEAMRSLPPVEASEELIRRTQRRIETWRPPRITPARVVWAAAASIAAVLGLIHLHIANMAPSPYDLRVLGQREWLAGSEASLRVVVLDRQRNRPVEGVPVEIDLASGDGRQTVQLTRFATDARGTAAPRLQLPDWPTGDYRLRVLARPGGQQDLVERGVRLKRSWQLMVTSDKPVYQPGQVIRVRSLALARPDLKPVAGREAVFAVTDPKGNVILRKRDATSRFGISAIDCPLASEVIEGPYRVECQVGDTTGSVTVQVQKYVLPKFKIAIELDRPYYQPGQRVRGSVEARYFFGKPVEEGEVEIEASAVEIRPVVFHRQKVRTDRSGKAAFELTLPDSFLGRPQHSGDARMTLAATVADAAGQKQSRTVSRTIAAEAIRVEVLPELGRLVQGLSNTVYLWTSYPDGRPARTRLAVTGIDREIATSDLGVASVEVVPEGELRWVIQATDAGGRIGRREVTLPCGAASGDFLVRTDRAVYDGGQTMRIVALGGGAEPVFLDLIKDGQTLLTDSLPMAGGRGEYQFDIPPGLFGTLELCAYRFNDQAIRVTKSRTIYVRPARTLAIETALDRPEYRPGDRAKLTISLRDRHGRPAPGAVSLAAVDEAVYSVLDQRPGMEKTFFALEQELLKPVYAIYPWSPDLDLAGSAEERNRFEQALFSRTTEREIDGRAALKKLVKQYAEGDERLLEVFERPDWEELAESMPWLPQELIAMARNRPVSHTIVADTYRERARQTEIDRHHAHETMIGAWVLFGLVFGLMFLFVYVRNAVGCLLLIAIGPIFMALMLPAVQSSREASRRSTATNDLRQLGLAIEEYKSTQADFPSPEKSESGPPPRVREWFPETLLWRPEVITDDNGRAVLDVDLADSITTWRLAASAVSADGSLGAAESGIRVFQPFFVDLNLPVALTRGDEAAIPAVVYNYLDKPQTVELTLAAADWFESRRVTVPVAHERDKAGSQVEASETLALRPGEVRSVSFPIRVKKVGRHELLITAKGGGVADAIKRQIEVLPDGRRVEENTSGTLQRPAEIAWNVPPGVIEGSLRATVRIHPSSFSQLVEGLDAIFQRPYGCFEQTSSTTYPNVLALDYLRRNKKNVPQVEAKAKQYIHLGYQRLLGFEVPDGGFDWFGRPPANRTLTAYGLMEFADMARVHDVDPKLIDRTRLWLLGQQEPDGTWSPESHGLHDDPTQRGDLARLNTTAYIAWAVFSGHASDPRARGTLQYLLRHEPRGLDDPYVLALVANALRAIDPDRSADRPYLDRLETMKRTAAGGKLAWWEQAASSRTTFYGAGRSGTIETTALAALAMLGAKEHPGTVRGSLAWLAEQKDPQGTWHSTQATVLALKALLAGTGRPLGAGQERRIEIALDGKTVRQIVIPADQDDVVQQADLSPLVTTGVRRLTITDRGDSSSGYQATLVYHVPGEPQATEGPLAIDVAYDRTDLAVDDVVTATAAITNRTPESVPMVILDLPIPAGFAVETDDFSRALSAGTIAKYQLTPRSVLVYLRDLAPHQPLVLRYRLRATMPVKAAVAPARVYEYYNPDRQAAGKAARFTVAGK